MRWVLMVGGLLMALIALPGYADGVGNAAIVYPVRINSGPLPNYPFSARAWGREGWVALDFNVLPDGNVENPQIIDGFNLSDFGKSAIEWIQTQKYSPGTLNGVPTIFHMQLNIAFHLGNFSGGGVRKIFANRLKLVDKLLGEKRFADAKAAILDYDGKAALLSEYSSLQVMLFRAEIGLGNWPAALRAIRVATDPELPALENSQAVDALTKEFLIEVDLGEYAYALYTYRRLFRAKGPSLDPNVRATFDKIKDEITANVPIVVSASLEEAWSLDARYRGDAKSSGIWSHYPLRAVFSLRKVNGQLDAVVFRCRIAVTIVAYKPDASWTIDPAWGGCRVEITGTPGTAFEYVEQPPARSSPPQPELMRAPPR